MKAPKKNLIAAALLAAPVFASALGLGGINVKSGLNQPLEAEIPVTVNSAAERESLSVMLANADDYARVGIDASRLSVPIEFAISKDSRGETVIRVTTKEAIREPFLQPSKRRGNGSLNVPITFGGEIPRQRPGMKSFSL